MFLLKVAFCLLLVYVVAADKKIELQDIEEDNLRSEKQKRIEKSQGQSQSPSAGTAPGTAPFNFIKNGLLHYFESPNQQPRYVQQYDVTEQPERLPNVAPKPQYGPPGQQAVVGYLSNVPMQLYLVPQYYNEPTEQVSNQQSEVQITAPAVGKVQAYKEKQPVGQQSNYIEIPTYVTPTTKPYVRPYTPNIIYVSHSQPTIAPAQAAVTPVLAYQPVDQYSTAIAAPPAKGYYQSSHLTETNSANEAQLNEFEIHKPYSSSNDIHSFKQSGSNFPRYYNSRAPIREEYRTPIELPHPSALLIRPPPSHLSHIPKILPEYRPITKPVYSTGAGFTSSAFTPKPIETYNYSFKRRPTSLLDSYIPSSVQIEFLKRGFTKDPLAAYEALSSARYLSQTPVVPRHYERGFLPNEMYHTAGGGITYGHHKRAPKLDRFGKQ